MRVECVTCLLWCEVIVALDVAAEIDSHQIALCHAQRRLRLCIPVIKVPSTAPVDVSRHHLNRIDQMMKVAP